MAAAFRLQTNGLAMRKGAAKPQTKERSDEGPSRPASPDNKDFSPQFDDQRE
ncbi:hypothetical protein SGRA_3778 [Saprospira grandis str. Lewin]|uniref:Uncharacterized protein n=1 Tax=Saprospira grandis (strain Lewin) TaxID=984262 RepID=H6L8D0_SAPGL|nr:hypothetical protein SGRA_3778 [Saprospira grandis str. Lewin]